MNLTLSEDLVLQNLSVVDIGTLLTFDDDVKDLSLYDEKFVEATENGISLFFGMILSSKLHKSVNT